MEHYTPNDGFEKPRNLALICFYDSLSFSLFDPSAGTVQTLVEGV